MRIPRFVSAKGFRSHDPNGSSSLFVPVLRQPPFRHRLDFGDHRYPQVHPAALARLAP